MCLIEVDGERTITMEILTTVEETPKVNNVIDTIKVVVEGKNNTLNELYSWLDITVSKLICCWQKEIP
jgi:hypothetical protein